MEQIDLSGFTPLTALFPAEEMPGDGGPAEGQSSMSIGQARLHEAEDVGPGALPQEQIEGLPPALDLAVIDPPKIWERRGAALMAFCRESKSKKRLQEKNAALEQSLQQAQQTLKVVTTMLPAVARLLGHARVHELGKKRGLAKEHFILLCRAAHLPASSAINLGLKHKRLILSATQLLLRRQELGLSRILSGSAAVLSRGVRLVVKERYVHLTYNHMWDETQVRQKRFQDKDKKYKDNNMGVLVQTIVQRGHVQYMLLDGAKNRCGVFGEEWLALPKEVQGTSAMCLFPAITETMPSQFVLGNSKELVEVAKSVSSITLMPLCDKASGNLLILKHWTKEAQSKTIDTVGTNVLYFPDTCIVHLGARGKLVLKDLRHHTMRHFSIANLSKIYEVRCRMVHNLERLVARKFSTRMVGPPPQEVSRLSDFVDALFNMRAPHHNRGIGHGGGIRKSQRWQDLRFLCEMVNGDMQSGAWIHHCWDPTTNTPCCTSKEQTIEKTTVACINAMFGQSDPVPAESRWTHLLSNMSKTLLRAVVHRVGLECFECEDLGTEDEQVDVDADACFRANERTRRVRARRTLEYYADRQNTYQLGVFACLIKTYDGFLLYPMLGDVVGGSNLEDQCKLDMLLDERSSTIGECASEMLHMLQSWRVGGPSRAPWCVLDCLGAPMGDIDFMKWSRNQILRLASSVFRRFETKYSSLPYTLYRLCHDRSSDEEKRAVVQALLAAQDEDLDPYSRGVRTLYPTEEEVMSPACRASLRADFMSHRLSTDLIERLHAEIKHRLPKRAPARNFANLSRESMLAQAAVLHVNRGGQHPLSARPLGPPPATERIAIASLLDKVCVDGGEEDARSRPTLPPSLLDVGAGSAGDASMAATPCDTSATGAVVPRTSFAEEVVVERRFDDTLAPREVPPAPQGKRQGLNPFMLERNKHVQAARELKGSRLTAAELEKVRKDFQKFWDSLPDHDIYMEAYQSWRESEPVPSGAPLKVYKSSWGGGCSAAPISSAEFFEHHRQNGWPTDAEVFDPSVARALAPNSALESSWGDLSKVELWSIGARAHNVSPSRMPSEHQFRLVELGLMNSLLGMPKGIVDGGCILLIVSGSRLDLPHETFRVPLLVTGVCYRPQVFEVARCSFDVSVHETAPDLPLPSDCKVRSRPCRIANAYQSIDFQTSAELALDLVKCFSTMRLWVADHTVLDRDGTLLWCSITSLQDLGCLWEDGLTKPLGFGAASSRRKPPSAQSMLDKLFQGDPLSTASRRPPASKARSKAQSSGQGAPTGGRKRQRTKGPEVERLPQPLADEEADDTTSTVPVAGGGGGASEGDVGAEPASVNQNAEEMDLSDALSDIMSELEGEEFGKDEDDGDGLAEPAGGFNAEGRSTSAGTDGFDATTAAEVAEAFAEVVLEVGLGEARVEGEAAGSSSGSAAPMPQTPAVVSESPWDRLSAPSVAGYVYDGTRSVMRIQRGKPVGRVTVTCYRHPRCNFLLNLERAPPDSELFRWLFELEPARPDATPAEQKELAARHCAVAKAKWSAPQPEWS